MKIMDIAFKTLGIRLFAKSSKNYTNENSVFKKYFSAPSPRSPPHS